MEGQIRASLPRPRTYLSEGRGETYLKTGEFGGGGGIGGGVSGVFGGGGIVVVWCEREGCGIEMFGRGVGAHDEKEKKDEDSKEIQEER